MIWRCRPRGKRSASRGSTLLDPPLDDDHNSGYGWSAALQVGVRSRRGCASPHHRCEAPSAHPPEDRRTDSIRADDRNEESQALRQPAPFGAEWELRFGPNNRFRVLYEIDDGAREAHILAIGIKDGNRLLIGGEEINL
jgi:hypothetical protein